MAPRDTPRPRGRPAGRRKTRVTAATSSKSTRLRTPRLEAVLRAIDLLDEEELRYLPLALGDKLKALDRARAMALKQRIGARCDVLWPGEAELFDATLVGVDEDAGVAQVTMARDGPIWNVPPYTVRT